jgi:class II flagellar assembly regulator FliX
MVEAVRAGGTGGSVSGPAPMNRDGMKAADGQFRISGDAAPAAQKSRLSTVPAIGLDSMLALQAVDEAAERDRSARKRGNALIAALTDLQRTMLMEADPAAALRALTALTAHHPIADDPGLAGILRAIVLRSRVEIARLNMPPLDSAP